jgi:hypothetical protein
MNIYLLTIFFVITVVIGVVVAYTVMHACFGKYII